MSSYVFGIDPDNRKTISEGQRAGYSPDDRPPAREINQALFEANCDQIIGTSAQVAAGQATIYYDDVADNYKDKNSVVVALNDYDRVLLRHDTALTAVLKINGNNIFVQCYRGTVIDNASFNIELGAGCKTDIFVTTIANITLNASPGETKVNGIFLSEIETKTGIKFSDGTQQITAPKVFKQYLGDGTDFTVTGDSSWTTVNAIAVPFETSNNKFHLMFNFEGTVSGSSQITLTVSGLTFSFRQAVDMSQVTTFNYGSTQNHTTAGTGNIFIANESGQALYDYLYVSGNVELTGKPSWMD